MSVITYTKSGAKSSTITKLPKSIFFEKVENYELLNQVYVAEKANRRTNRAKTLKRGEVRGGGRKPWKQKGTGRARFGSIRNPIWRGGGIAFGPSSNENYSKKINRASKTKAIIQALSLANGDNRISVIEAFPNSGKTKDMAALLDKTDTSRAIIILGNITTELKRATSNIPGISIIDVSHLSASHILDNNQVVFTKDSLEMIEKRLGNK